MNRFRLVAVILAVALAGIAVKLAYFNEPGDDRSAERTAAHAARVGVQVAVQGGAPQPVTVPAPGAAANAASAAPVEALSGAERTFANAGVSKGEAAAMKQAWPDWETRFANASDDMVKAHASRVKDFVPTVIPDELSKVASVDVNRIVSQSAGMSDDLAHAGSGIRTGAAVGVADDIARGGASVLDDLLRVLGLGGAAAAAGGAAALAKKKK